MLLGDPLAATEARRELAVVDTLTGPASTVQSGRTIALRITLVMMNAFQVTAKLLFESGAIETTSLLASVATVSWVGIAAAHRVDRATRDPGHDGGGLGHPEVPHRQRGVGGRGGDRRRGRERGQARADREPVGAGGEQSRQRAPVGVEPAREHVAAVAAAQRSRYATVHVPSGPDET